jgi:prolyl-tRNA synthetase
VPFRLEIGPRDVASGTGVLVRRTDRVKESLPLASIAGELPARLVEYQAGLLERARTFQAAHTHDVDTIDAMREILDGEGGFLMAPWCGSGECEKAVARDLKATIRVIPFDSADEAGACIVDGKPSERRVLFARAY